MTTLNIYIILRCKGFVQLQWVGKWGGNDFPRAMSRMAAKIMVPAFTERLLRHVSVTVQSCYDVQTHFL